MATAIAKLAKRPLIEGRLTGDPRAIGGARFDAFCFWGAPLVAALFVWAWASAALALPAAAGHVAIALLIGAIAILTFAHLIAVVPRAYLNREVFAANRRRLTLVPVLLIAALLPLARDPRPRRRCSSSSGTCIIRRCRISASAGSTT